VVSILDLQEYDLRKEIEERRSGASIESFSKDKIKWKSSSRRRAKRVGTFIYV